MTSISSLQYDDRPSLWGRPRTANIAAASKSVPKNFGHSLSLWGGSQASREQREATHFPTISTAASTVDTSTYNAHGSDQSAQLAHPAIVVPSPMNKPIRRGASISVTRSKDRQLYSAVWSEESTSNHTTAPANPDDEVRLLVLECNPFGHCFIST